MLCRSFDLWFHQALKIILNVAPCKLKLQTQTRDSLTCITYYIQQSSKVPVLFSLHRMQRKSSQNIFSFWVLVQISRNIMAKPIPQTTTLFYWITRSLKQRHFKISTNSKYGFFTLYVYHSKKFPYLYAFLFNHRVLAIFTNKYRF